VQVQSLLGRAAVGGVASSAGAPLETRVAVVEALMDVTRDAAVHAAKSAASREATLAAAVRELHSRMTSLRGELAEMARRQWALLVHLPVQAAPHPASPLCHPACSCGCDLPRFPPLAGCAPFL